MLSEPGDITARVRYVVRLVLQMMTSDMWERHDPANLSLNDSLNNVVGGVGDRYWLSTSKRNLNCWRSSSRCRELRGVSPICICGSVPRSVVYSVAI